MPDPGFAMAALAGVLSFLSPCLLPVVPFYLVALSGGALGGPDAALSSRGRALAIRVASATAFAAGVLTVFGLLGLGASTAGRIFAAWQREASWFAAAILAVFAGHFLGFWRIGLLDRQAGLADRVRVGGLGGGYLLGLAFGFGWSPCVGPVLAGVLMLASGQEAPLRGAALLLTYGAGMTLPFVLAAAFAGPFLRWLARRPRLIGQVERVTGVALLVLAALIATDSMMLIAVFLLEQVPAFARLG